MQTRRLISGIAGGLLLAGTFVEACLENFGFYQEHYLWPMQKYGVLTPLRWQDMVFIATFWLVIIGLFYFSYRLLRYAWRGRRSVRG
jgi:hypothetical protein